MTKALTYRQVSVGLILMVIAALSVPNRAFPASITDDLPPAARLVLSKAGTMINKKEYAKAASLLKSFLDRGGPVPAPGEPDPKGRHHPEIYFALGTCYLMEKDYGNATGALEQAVKRNPAHVSAWLNLARVSYDRNHYIRAAQSFEQAYGYSHQKNPDHLYYSASAWLLAEKHDRCLTVFRKLFKQHPDAVKPAWRENYIHALLAAGRSREALSHIRRLSKIYTGDKQIQWQEILLHKYLELNMRQQARDYAVFLTRQNPINAKWWKALTHVELQAGRYERALVPMIIYSFLSPLTMQEKKLLADLHLQSGIPVKAAPLYEAVLKEKHNHRLIKNLALALQQSGEFEKALKQLDRFAPNTQNHGLMMLRADLLYHMEKYDQALTAYRKAAGSKGGKAGRAWLMAGYAAFQIKDETAGIKAFENAARFPEYRKAALVAMRRLPRANKER